MTRSGDSRKGPVRQGEPPDSKQRLLNPFRVIAGAYNGPARNAPNTKQENGNGHNARQHQG